MEANKCAGITKAGNPCKIKVKDGKYCHYHLYQAKTAPATPMPRSTPSSPKKTHLSPQRLLPKLPTTPPKLSHQLPLLRKNYTPSPPKGVSLRMPFSTASPTSSRYKAGFIYLYTMASLLNKEKGEWLRTRNLLGSRKDEWTTVNPLKHKMMLVKVGMTTQKVDDRIKQWESKCGHKLVCLHPNASLPKSGLSLTDYFRKLTISKSPSASLASFRATDRGFFVPRNVWHAEQEIHGELKKLFGRGDVYCQGCMEDKGHHELSTGLTGLFKKNNSDDFISRRDYNVHTEWFPIPLKRMDDVYHIIDSVCTRYNTQ